MPAIIDQIDVAKLTPDDYVKLVYLCLLRRPIDETGLQDWRIIIEEQGFDHKKLVDAVLNSPEYLMSHVAHFSAYVHRARQLWIQDVESFERILDIGGSSGNIEAGALIELGYPHRPRELIIFDLPEEMQYWGKPKFSQNQEYAFDWGRVRYLHGFVENIQQFTELADRRFDCVFMGQTLEHIDFNHIGTVFQWIRGHLRAGGKFIFDTPNRDVTRLQMPYWYIDEDHKHEYAPDEAEELLNRHGFEVIKRTGLVNMPRSCRDRVFEPIEAMDSDLVCDEPETSYVFAFECASR